MNDVGVAAAGFAAGVATALLVTRIIATYLVKLRRRVEDE